MIKYIYQLHHIFIVQGGDMMDYQVESVEQINNFTVTNYVPTEKDVKTQKQIILILCNIFSSDNKGVDIKVKGDV
jgi:hypothetical protein